MSSAARPLILLTNDDGILSDGIAQLHAALEPLGEVIVSAPSRQQSAVSHSISLHEPLRVRTIGPGRYAVAGTPADAVFIAICEICPRVPDVVVSGINHGSNLGTDVFYSGTVAGALEGALRGVPAIAVSQQMPAVGEALPSESDDAQKANAWDPLEHLSPHLEQLLRHTAQFTAALVAAVLSQKDPPRALNVNSPNRPAYSWCWTRVGTHQYRSRAVRRTDPRGNPYYWIGDSAADEAYEPGTDSHAVQAGMFSVSPIDLNWTAELEQAQAYHVEGFPAVSIAAR